LEEFTASEAGWLGSAFFWGTVVAVLAGLTLAGVTQRGRTPRQKARLAASRAVLLPLGSNFILAALAAAWIFTQGKGWGVPTLATSLGIFVAVFAAFRFPQTVGVPVLFLAAISAGLLWWSLRTCVPVQPGEDFLTTRLLAKTPEAWTVETRGLVPRVWKAPEVRTLPPSTWLPVKIRVVRLPVLLEGQILVSTAEPDFLGRLVLGILNQLGWESDLEVSPPDAPGLFHVWGLSVGLRGGPVWDQRIPRATLE
jgi:hypothetical protein